MNFNQLNAHSRDPHIEFEPESHKYYHCGIEYKSVTTVVESLFEAFDAEYWSRRKTRTEEEAAALRAEWEKKATEARDMGTEMHARIERFFLDDEQAGACDDHCYRLFRRFQAKFNLRPYRTEWRIYHEEARLAGTLDFLAYDGNGFEIYDWKRSNKLVDGFGNTLQSNPYGKTGTGIASDIPDTSLYRYALQLSVYRYILETKYGINPQRSFLGVFAPALDRPYRISVPYLKDRVEALVDELSR